jgi:hypothetical protein
LSPRLRSIRLPSLSVGPPHCGGKTRLANRTGVHLDPWCRSGVARCQHGQRCRHDRGSVSRSGWRLGLCAGSAGHAACDFDCPGFALRSVQRIARCACRSTGFRGGRWGIGYRHSGKDGDTSFFAISQAAPGPNVLLVSLIGWHIAGFAGLAIATLAMIFPSSLLAFIAGRLVSWWQSTRWIKIAHRLWGTEPETTQR